MKKVNVIYSAYWIRIFGDEKVSYKIQLETDKTIEKIKAQNPELEFFSMEKTKYAPIDTKILPPKFTDKYRPWR